MEEEFDPRIVAGIVFQTLLSNIETVEKFLNSLPDTRIIFVKKVPGNEKLYIMKVRLKGDGNNGTSAGNLWE